MLDDEKDFRSYPVRHLGHGIAVSYAMNWVDEGLQTLTYLVGSVYVAARIINKGVLAQNARKPVLPIVADTFIFEGVATILVPTLIVQACTTVTDAVLRTRTPIALALGVSLIFFLHNRIDKEVSRLMDQTVRRPF
ncbi:mitochondrial fission process protein 1 [Elysia marginata]|uniref:Mitochondrial fission process protein 1 n=1 Tax=Elysia marginata TaxID=1093978 RepID=A0AAV4JJQ5_9GAST|nr:mitochondrial fission process protein 1 [Elysia marginata]